MRENGCGRPQPAQVLDRVPGDGTAVEIVDDSGCKAPVRRVTIRAQDEDGNQTTKYVGTVCMTSSDPKALLPPDYTFREARWLQVTLPTPGKQTMPESRRVEGDNGACGLSVTLQTPGEQTITVTDTVNNTIAGRATVRVAP